MPAALAGFADAMSSFASGVTVVTALDDAGNAHGYAAPAFSSVSIDPPLVLTCLSPSAVCFPVFRSVGSFCVNMLSADDEHLAMHFANKHPDKFTNH